MAKAMTDKEYERWIRDILEKPIRRKWANAWKLAMSPELRSAVVHAECFRVVHAWTDDDRGHTVSEAEIVRLLRVAHKLFDGELD